MQIKHKFDICVVLIGLSLVFLLFGMLGYRPKPIVYNGFRAQDMVVPIPEYVESEDIVEIPSASEAMEVLMEIRRKMGEVRLTCKKLVLGNSYRVFFTAYCPEECGYRVFEDGTDNFPVGHITSTGTICHRSSEFMRYEPSTCGVDPRYFPYGTMFYVPSEDRVYIAEDTGYISGAWIDTYQENMKIMLAYNVRYEDIYIVEFEYYEVLASNYDVLRYVNDITRNAV